MNDLRNELERLAERGPHREPSQVVGDALDDLSEHARRTRPRWPAVAAAVLLLGLIGALAAQIPSDDPPAPADQPPQPLPLHDDDDAGGSDLNNDESVPTTLASRERVRCDAVRFEFTAAPDGFELSEPTGISRSIGLEGYMPMEWLFMSRGGDTAWLPSVPAGREDELVEVEIMGYPTVIYPAAMGSGGPRTTFVYPPESSPDDPCNVWSMAYNNPDMSAVQLAELVGNLQMSELD